jgi:hypothetical protein
VSSARVALRETKRQAHHSMVRVVHRSAYL